MNQLTTKGFYKKFLSKCFCARVKEPKMANVFLWITWSPFSTTKWERLHSTEEIFKSVIDNCEQTLGETDKVAAENRLAEPNMKQVIEYLAENIWIIVLCEQQEHYLTLSRRDRKLLMMKRMEEDNGNS